MINIEFKPCCYTCDNIDLDYDEITFMCGKQVNVYCKHCKVCKQYIEDSTKHENKDS